MQVDALSTRLSQMITAKVQAGSLELPAMPWNRALLTQRLSARGAVGDLIERDPMLTAECLRVLATRARRPPAASIEAIVQGLGKDGLRMTLNLVAQRRVYESKNLDVQQFFEGLCGHAVAVAETARQLSVHAALPAPETAYLAGLLHDCGRIVVGIHLLDLERAAVRGGKPSPLSPQHFQALTNEAHGPVSLAMAERFRFPPQVAVFMANPDEYDTADRKSLANVIRLAKSIAQSAGAYLGAFDEGAAKARVVIGRSLLDVRDDVIGHLVNAALQAARESVA